MRNIPIYSFVNTPISLQKYTGPSSSRPSLKIYFQVSGDLRGEFKVKTVVVRTVTIIARIEKGALSLMTAPFDFLSSCVPYPQRCLAAVISCEDLAICQTQVPCTFCISSFPVL